MPESHRSVFTGWMPFLPPNQQRQSTEGLYMTACYLIIITVITHTIISIVAIYD